jgi:hypothetical protein
VLIVMGLVFGQDPPHIGLVPDEGAVQDLASASPDPASAIRSERHLVRVLAEYIERDNHARPIAAATFDRRTRALWVLPCLWQLSASAAGTGSAG